VETRPEKISGEPDNVGLNESSESVKPLLLEYEIIILSKIEEADACPTDTRVKANAPNKPKNLIIVFAPKAPWGGPNEALAKRI